MNHHLDTLLAQHRELRELAGAYRTELDRPTPDLAALGKCRWTLTRLISQHLAFEAMHLYPALERRGPQAAAVGQAAAFEIGQLTAALGAHVRDWTVEQIQEGWPSYRQASKDLIQRLTARMDREEADLYPLAKQAKAA